MLVLMVGCTYGPCEKKDYLFQCVTDSCFATKIYTFLAISYRMTCAQINYNLIILYFEFIIVWITHDYCRNIKNVEVGA